MGKQPKPDKHVFERFHGTEIDRYNYYTIPTALFRDPYFKDLSMGAKVTYAALLNRTSLSIRNNWIDKNGDVYIIYPVDDLASDLGVSHPTAVKYLKELRADTGIGLVEVERIGLNQANLIYVTNFSKLLVPSTDEKNQEESRSENTQEEVSSQEEENDNKSPESRINSGSKKTLLQEVNPENEENSRKLKNLTSRSNETLLHEIKNVNSNNPDNNNLSNTNLNNDLSIYLSDTDTYREDEKAASQPIDRMDGQSQVQKQSRQTKNHDIYKALILSNIDYDNSFASDPHEKDLVNEIVDLMTDIVCSTNETIKINGQPMDGDTVRSRLLKLNQEHIQYVLDAMKRTTTDIKNPRAYLLTTLYNSPTSLTTYWDARVRHDMASG